MPPTHQDTQVDVVAPAASTALDRRSTSVSTNTGSALSTVTRTTGSVPDGRRNARPRPASIACTADNSVCTDEAVTACASHRTLRVPCGNLSTQVTARPEEGP